MASAAGEADIANVSMLARRFLPNRARSEVAIPAPGAGEGFWAGASSAVESDGFIYLAYRLRQPVELGRGLGVAVARSQDGVRFTTIAFISKEMMDAESLERPALVRTPDKKWRLYLSCATTGTKHWRVELLEAERPEDFNPAHSTVVLPGDESWGVKDPVIVQRDSLWHLWATFHPLDLPEQEDRMVSRYATSVDGLTWTWAEGNALAPREGLWDARGARITAVHFADGVALGFYDGRATANENFEERTGVAAGRSPDSFLAQGVDPWAESPTKRALRYLDIVPLTDGSYRIYYEVATVDGSHELRTEHIRSM